VIDPGQLVSALRFGDSAFPSGGFAFSSGLEGADRDGWVRDETDVADFAAEQLDGRWHRCDRVLFRAAWTDPDPRAADALAEAVATMSVLRAASRRAGAATLATFSAVVDAGLGEYRAQVLAGTAPGHLPVVQAICLRATGLTLPVAETVVAWQLVAGIVGAATRLGIVGHLGAQRVLGSLTGPLSDVLARQPRDSPAAFTAYADIAAQRRGAGTRLFAS
jgi:urease accessory protein